MPTGSAAATAAASLLSVACATRWQGDSHVSVPLSVGDADLRRHDASEWERRHSAQLFNGLIGANGVCHRK